MKNVIIIAEAGVNHNGSIDIARKLIDAAAVAGADYVKFQSFKAKNLVSPLAKKAEYQVKNSDNHETQFQMLEKLELSEEDHRTLMDYCRQRKIKFLSTAFDLESLQLLINLGMEVFKIPSGEVTNYPLLRKIGQQKKKVILSTGMCVLEDIKNAISVLMKFGTVKEDITVLHCNTEYPTPMQDVNLLAMNAIKKEFEVEVGYSDHTTGIEVSIAAVALGASVIEKHFTIDKTMAGPDHAASLDPKELSAMVAAIRNTQTALGTDLKKPSGSEIKNMVSARKSIHLNKDLSAGEIIREVALIALRPGDGISPMEWENIIGKTTKRDLKAGTKINLSDLE